ncbi:MAG: thermonuclease family protein [Rhodospirillaceae bacterium]|nr:thermonuclease family protein [Rhodospirillaceae bacterium]
MVRRFASALAVVIGLILAVAPPSAVETATLVQDGIGTAREIVDGDTLVLADGRSVRLVGIQAPKLPLGRANFPTWPLAEQARAALSDLTLGRRLTLSFGGARADRYRRVLAHLHIESQTRGQPGIWVQGEMLRLGLARVYTFADNRAMAAEMFAIERAARAARRGLWSDDYYRVLNPEETAGLVDTFQIVEGIVLKVQTVGGRTYLNFGPDYRTDFTASIPSSARRLFTAARIDPQLYAGSRVRIRGWLGSLNGPTIEVSHPEQIEEVRP